MHHSRPSQFHPPFSPAPCPIASSWASPSGSSLSASPYASSASPAYTLPRSLRIANLIKPWIPIILYVITTLGFLVAVSFWKVEVFQGAHPFAVALCFGHHVYTAHVTTLTGLDDLSRWLKSDTYQGYAVIFTLIFITTIREYSFPFIDTVMRQLCGIPSAQWCDCDFEFGIPGGPTDDHEADADIPAAPVPLYSTLIILAGYTFGPWTGVIISYWASLAGAIVVFTLSRTFFRASISRWLSCTSWIKRSVRAIENNPKLLFLIRLAPYPYNVMNCLLAASPSLTFRTYTVCTALSLPKLIIHTSIGSSIHSFAEYHVKRPGSENGEDYGSTLSHYSTVAGIGLCLAIFVYLSYITRKAVDEELRDEDAMDATYSEERIAFLSHEEGNSPDLEEHMTEAPHALEIRQVPTRGNSPTPVSLVVAEAAGIAHVGHVHGPAGSTNLQGPSPPSPSDA
ncbi:transporter [Ganoderma sinense ZZ0214-1]|uniref:Golgi apparatus membrane protein TVP38 n=1 Tax=Ganoderma sinense ZZ0214-1 TaxID=1077348 RepID=A0A2G8ST93_9APHY|nr:transporter [Ganoderma sinense ZZ0214-1]